MLLLAVILISVHLASPGTGDPSNNGWSGDRNNSILFTLVRSCTTWARLRWEPSPDVFPVSSNSPRFATCEIMYMNLRLQEAKLLLVVPSPHVSELTLENLLPHAHYTASMTCNETFASPTIGFVTGYPCTDAEVEKERSSQYVNTTEMSEVSRRPVQLNKSSVEVSVTDAVLGLLFALCGVTIILCAALYYWKRRRHRQRILRIFRQSQSDPFLALNNSTDQIPASSF